MRFDMLKILVILILGIVGLFYLVVWLLIAAKIFTGALKMSWKELMVTAVLAPLIILGFVLLNPKKTYDAFLKEFKRDESGFK